MIGYPTADGSCGSYLYFHSLTGVNAFSQKPELAWEYLKYMVSGERYHGNLNWGGTIPLKKNYTEELLQHLRNPYAEYEGKSIVVNQDGTFTVDGISGTYDDKICIRSRDLSDSGAGDIKVFLRRIQYRRDD